MAIDLWAIVFRTLYAENDGSEDLKLVMLMLVYTVHSDKLIWDVDLNIVAMSATVPANQGIVLRTQSPFKEVMSSSCRAACSEKRYWWIQVLQDVTKPFP